MQDFNSIIVVGRLGSDPEMRYTQSGEAVTTFNIANNERVKDKDVTTWYKVTLWGKQAENALNLLKKGQQVLVRGRLKFYKWTTDNGEERNQLQIIYPEFQIFGKKPAEEATEEYAVEDVGELFG